uniref:Uncharacterized protein n=1 Tax=Anopheles coluzzii TaxID=1518534 RepID=A0A8W7PT72_ANOCL
MHRAEQAGGDPPELVLVGEPVAGADRYVVHTGGRTFAEVALAKLVQLPEVAFVQAQIQTQRHQDRVDAGSDQREEQLVVAKVDRQHRHDVKGCDVHADEVPEQLVAEIEQLGKEEPTAQVLRQVGIEIRRPHRHEPQHALEQAEVYQQRLVVLAVHSSQLSAPAMVVDE